MCKTATMPGTRAITPIQLDYQGDQIQIAGDKAGTPENVAVNWYNDENFALRNAFELWIETIQQDNTGFRTSPILYQATDFKVKHMDHLKQPIRIIHLVRAWPDSLDGMALSWAPGGTILESTTNIVYDYWRLASA